LKLFSSTIKHLNNSTTQQLNKKTAAGFWLSSGDEAATAAKAAGFWLTAQRLNNSTPEHLNTSTTQRLNNSTTQQLNKKNG